VQKVWRVSQAIGDIAFAYPYSLILLEIQVAGARPLHPELRKPTRTQIISTTNLLFRFCLCRTRLSHRQPRTRQ
jgi:hypothetical protein